MNHSQTLIEAYATADETQQLSMFLSYRDLRDDFMKIELAQRIHRRQAASTDVQKHRNNRFLRSCWQWLRV